MATLLIIDTSSTNCSVVISQDQQLYEITSIKPKTHAKLLLSMIDELLGRAKASLMDLDALAVVSGPGSFTGLRIGIGVVQGLAYALTKPVILLSSLELLAVESASSGASDCIIVSLKSKQDEIYLACYKQLENGEVELIDGEQVIAPAEVKIPTGGLDCKRWCGVGDGWQYLTRFKADIFKDSIDIDESLTISAKSLGKIAQSNFKNRLVVNAEKALPNYLKDQLDYKVAQ